MMKYLLALVLLLQGCSTTPRAPFDYNEVKRVGVVSIMGDTAGYYRLGMTVFGNNRGEFKVADANLDALYQENIERALAAMERYEVVHLEYDPAALIAREEEEVKRSFGDALWQRAHWKLADHLKEMAGQHQLDAILVLAPGRAYTGTNVSPEGISVYFGGLAGNVSWCHIGAYSNLSLVNGKDGFVVQARSVKKETSFLEGSNDFLAGEPKVTRKFDAHTCEIGESGPTGAQQEDFHNTFKTVITPRHLSNTLEKLMKKQEIQRLTRP
ncbi:hypothetical protein [Alcanivorax sp. 1008]|uniref:hypothetical protein n=1 Tax=Alcanivorax sp. 1008 TaxID=2816853 RepID=UPI001DEE6D06|nr:hypothetical protein [Alcanivorax sp. 1008]MCC1498337.1 hypothetical protein [Alcanivorax sp. 1008]